ncbi:MAG: GntR family transcriptional regulator [Anaerolineae bacterium]|nr:GntR family transcriptional regulator [Anaerolineae bacterium]
MPPLKTKKDSLVEIIREAILRGELEPGDRLLQEELAERFNTSSTPVREALRELEAEGILQHSPYRGVQIAEVRLEDVREIYMIRGVLEAMATRLAVPYLNSAHISRLREMQARTETHISAGEFKELRKLNYEFHMLIYLSAGMPQLLKIIKSLWTKFPWDTLHVLPGRAVVSAREHIQIIQAIEDQDPKAAGQAMQAHIEHGAASLAEYVAQNST